MRLLFGFFVLAFLLVGSCTSTPDGPYKLTTTIPFNCLSYVDLIEVTDEHADFYECDTIHKNIVHVFDSIVAREVTVSFFSLLTNDYRKIIELDQDTTVAFDSSLYSTFKQGEFEDIFNMVLNEKDTLYIGYKSNGCVSFSQKNENF